MHRPLDHARVPPALALALVVAVVLSAGCATQSPTRTGFIDASQPMQRTTGNVRAQADIRSDPARLAKVTAIQLEPSKVAPGVTLPASIAPESVSLVLGELDRQMCFEMSRYFTIANSAEQATRVQAAVTGLQETSAAASVASATISRFIPGPGSVRLPIGRGGLSIEARADLPANGGEAAAMAWSRGAGVAFDKGSLSEVGDAHRYASDFAKAFAELLAGPDAKRGAVPETDPCARFGPRLDVGRSALGIGLGLHMPKPASGTETKSSPGNPDANTSQSKDVSVPQLQPSSR